jgi:hypothetical protein
LPPDVRDWLPADHLAWFVIDAVAEMDLGDFYAAYRADGHGRAAYEPSVMVPLILYAFATSCVARPDWGAWGVSIDGTRIAGNASPGVNYEFERIAGEIVAEAKATDEAEDELYGEGRGDELPEQLRTPGRREFFRQVKRELEREDGRIASGTRGGTKRMMSTRSSRSASQA